AERVRVGMRQGRMWWGRERLAEGEYKSAVAAHEKGNNSSALWHLNAAINLNPKFAEAHDLRARIQGKEVTAVDNSTVRGFVSRAIMKDRGATTQPAMPEGEQSPTTLPTAEASAEEPTSQPFASDNNRGEEPTTTPPEQ